MPVMPGDDHTTEEPTADPLEEQAALKERINRLDETLARISEMLPLLTGETKRDLES
jgi:hypothetical protein